MKFGFSILLIAFYVCTAFSQDNPYQSHADKLFESGEHERAFRLYGNAIKADLPEHGNYRLFLNAGDCAFHLNFKQIALNYYGLSTLRNVPTNELINRIKSTYCEDDLLCASDALKKITQKHPETQSYLLPEIATILFNKSKYLLAIPILKECLTFHPNDFSIQKMLAESFFNTGDADNAYVLYKDIAQHNHDFDSFVFLGNYYYVAANKLVKMGLIPEDKKSKSIFSRKETEEITDAETEMPTDYYHKAGEYLEKAFTIYNSEEIRKSLIEIYTIIGNKDKINTYKKLAKK